MGRKKKLIDTTTGNFTKEQIAQRKLEEKALEDFKPITSTPPSWLDRDAKAEFRRIVPLLSKLPIAALDMSSVVMYCDFWSVYKRSSQAVTIEGRVITEMDSQGNDKRKVNPEFTTMKDAARMVQTIAGTLGLTIDSRMRIVVPKKEVEEDPFGAMLDD